MQFNFDYFLGWLIIISGRIIALLQSFKFHVGGFDFGAFFIFFALMLFEFLMNLINGDDD